MEFLIPSFQSYYSVSISYLIPFWNKLFENVYLTVCDQGAINRGEWFLKRSFFYFEIMMTGLRLGDGKCGDAGVILVHVKKMKVFAAFCCNRLLCLRI
ncbi:hypothetical protein ABD86_00550 [Paenibacillus alvei]|nr:hypothetical protein [Paenibacillus alvei]MBG9742488.1 hypothetical protein [Paenibacillus alvei]